MRTRLLSRALLLGAALAVSACDRAQPAPAEPSAPDRVLADSALTASVKAALMADEAMRGRSIEVRAQQGVIQLSGAPREVLERAAELVRSVQGVVRVEIEKR